MTGREFAEGLRRIADWYGEHPDFPQPTSLDSNGVFTIYASNLEEVTKLKKGLGATVVEADDYSIRVYKSFGSVQLSVWASRGNVCKKRVVGTKKVWKKEATQWTEREVEEDIVEWDCPPELTLAEEIKHERI